MRVAAIDIGTNTFLLLIAEQVGEKFFKIVDEVRIVRLGQGVHDTRLFHQEALERANNCLREFREIIDKHGPVDRIQAIATSASRDVKNAQALFEIATKYHLPLQIISGEQEAQFSYAGACADFSDQKKRIVIDIGGGSTELIFGEGKKLLQAQSLDIGAVRLTEMFIKAQPIPELQQQSVIEYVQHVLQGSRLYQMLSQTDELIAVAGTPTALVVAEIGKFDSGRIEGAQLSLSKLENWQTIFASTSIEEKKVKYALGGRADIIYAGTTILKEIIKASGHPHISVSTKGLRYGVAAELFH